MDSIQRKARMAGVWYLLVAVIAPFHFYVPGKLIVPGNAASTAANLAAGELLWRIGIFAGLAERILFLLLVLSLYDLFKDVDRRHARLMVALVGVSVAVGIARMFTDLAPMVLLSGADYLSAFPSPQLEALAMAFLKLGHACTSLQISFWALWLLPFGLLVIKSKFFPKILGVLLIVGCAGYLVLSFTGIVFPAHLRAVNRIAMPFYAVGELAMIAWLLIKGAKAPEALESKG